MDETLQSAENFDPNKVQKRVDELIDRASAARAQLDEYKSGGNWTISFVNGNRVAHARDTDAGHEVVDVTTYSYGWGVQRIVAPTNGDRQTITQVMFRDGQLTGTSQDASKDGNPFDKKVEHLDDGQIKDATEYALDDIDKALAERELTSASSSN